MILPSALRYQAEVAGAVAAAKAAGIEVPSQSTLLKTLAGAIGDLQTASGKLEHALAHHAEGDPYSHTKHARDAIIPAMTAVRAAGDALEGMVADDLWPLPTYREMLFIK
jgi:glutamine synthetase